MAQRFNIFSSRGEKQSQAERKLSDIVLIRRLYDYMKHERKDLMIGTVAIVLSCFTGLLTPYFHKVAIDQILTPMNLSGFIWWVPLFTLILLIHYVLQYYQQYHMRIVGERIVERLRGDLISRIQAISLRYFSEGQIGRVMSRPTNDANQVRMFLRNGLPTIILDTAQIGGTLVIIFFLDFRLALISVAILPFALGFAWFLGKVTRKVHRNALTSLAGLTAKFQENFSGMKVIKSFSREDKTATEFHEIQDEYARVQTHAITVTASVQPSIMVMRVIGTALVLYFGALLVRSGEITIGLLVAFNEYQFRFFQPIVSLTTVYDQYQSAMAASERLFDLLDTTEEVKDIDAEKAVQIGTLKSVVFDNTTFGYDPKIPVIKNISFDLEASKKLALVGPTGAGKSTIINLISRFYDPLDGTILINNHDIKDIRLSDLREHMSIVLQDSFLFPICVKDNIRFGKPEATEEEVIEAAKIVGAHEFIMNLPGGYDYAIQENSSNISIGQRQLISFARTLLMNPQLLILDEATSSIDPYTELVLQNALKKLLEGRMAIIIAHRLSTIRLCDEIIVLDQGKIVERGTHFELMEKNGLYSSFYKMQFKEENGLTADATTPSS